MPWQVYAGILLAVLWPVGLAERKAQRLRRRWVLHREGYEDYADYVCHGKWSSRRARWIREHGNPPCRLCGGARRHLHHKSYWHAGAGLERDRDLMPVSRRCHEFIHAWDNRLKRLGVPLRWTTWLCVGMLWPVRLVRGRRAVVVR